MLKELYKTRAAHTKSNSISAVDVACSKRIFEYFFKAGKTCYFFDRHFLYCMNHQLSNAQPEAVFFVH